MRNLNRFNLFIAALMFSFASYAGDIEVSGGWTRATAPGQDQAGVDLTITSKQAATLVGVSSPAAKSATLHSMTTGKDGMMRMREVKSIELPAGMAVNLEKSAYHVMLENLKAPLKEGGTVPLTLSIKVGKHGVVKIESIAEVKSLTATEAPSDDHEHMHMDKGMKMN